MKNEQPIDGAEVTHDSISFKYFIEYLTGQPFEKVYKDFLPKGEDNEQEGNVG